MMWSRRRIRISWAFVLLALISLATLAGFQYHWLGELSRAERERMRSGLAVSSQLFAEDFNRELTRIFLHFLPLATQTGDLAPALGERLGRWQRGAALPELVRDVLQVEILARGERGTEGDVAGDVAGDAAGVRVRRFEVGTGKLEEIPPPPELAALLAALEARQARSRRVRPGGSAEPPPLLAPEVPAVLVPRFEALGSPRRRPPRNGGPGAWSGPPGPLEVLVVRLDEAVLRGTLLPRLGQRHLARGGHLDYDYAVVGRGGLRGAGTQGGKGSGASAGAEGMLFCSDPSLGPEHFLTRDMETPLFALLEAGELQSLVEDPFGEASPGGEEEPGGGEGREGEGRSGRRARFSGRLLGSLLTAAGQRGAWHLLVRHREGSLEAAVARTRHRNLGVSLGVLLLLATTVATLLVESRRAEQLGAQQVEFVAGISHELRTPLAAIRSLGQNLGAGVVRGPEQVQEYGKLIEKEEARLSRMVEQALAFAGILSGREVYDPVRIDAGDLVRRIVGELGGVFAELGVEVEWTAEEELLPVLADPAALGQALSNLLLNAVKYRGGKAWIGVRAWRVGEGGKDEVAIAVADRGPGIPRDELPHLFEPFFRGRGARGEQIPGSGLGLSLVRHVVEAHGGRVEVDSEVGQGSTFTLYLPRAEKSGPKASRTGASKTGASKTGARESRP